MDITQLKRGDRGIVSLVEGPPRLRERLRSLDIRSGGVVRVLKVSPLKKTFIVQAGGSRVALSKEVAQCVTVRKV